MDTLGGPGVCEGPRLDPPRSDLSFVRKAHILPPRVAVVQYQQYLWCLMDYREPGVMTTVPSGASRLLIPNRWMS